MNFNFQKFSNELYKDFKDRLNESEVQSLLDLNESYNKDTPVSTGKRLILTYLSFRGVKTSVDGYDYSGQQIDYRQEILEGVNIWIADNLKGKSSIFKIVKYALTGNSSIKQNVKKWIHEIILNFKISEKDYTIILTAEKRLKGALYNGSFKTSDELNKLNPDPIFSATSETQYQEEIQSFYFQQFSYYGLKWTQKNSAKDNTNLVEAETSWSTYFKSILLESKDSGEMYGYGSQGKKILEMLLGLELTFPINRLKIKKDRLNEQKGKERDYIAREKASSPVAIQELKLQLDKIIQSIAEHSKSNQETINVTSLYARYNETLEKIQTANRNAIEAETDVVASKSKINSIISKKRNREAEKERVILEIQKVKRRIFDLNEYLEIGIFFSNLDIKQCPSCSHEISENKKSTKVKSGECYVCSEHIDTDESEDDRSIYEEKIENLKTILSGLELELENINNEMLNFETEYEQELSRSQTLEARKATLLDTSNLKAQLQELEQAINLEKAKGTNIDLAKEKLITEKAILEFRISELEKLGSVSSESDIDAKIELLAAAILKLTTLRYTEGNKVLNRFSDLMLSELHALGLTSVSRVRISENFDITYQQDGDFLSFDNIVEGEQLRAKIAMYLSLIQMDIEFNFGRHTRFLIIDSPGKEEADKNYLQGFAEIVKGVQDRFGSQLQILIGTAERELENVVVQQNVTPANQYVF
jgi:hypothetical protein